MPSRGAECRKGWRRYRTVAFTWLSRSRLASVDGHCPVRKRLQQRIASSAAMIRPTVTRRTLAVSQATRLATATRDLPHIAESLQPPLRLLVERHRRGGAALPCHARAELRERTIDRGPRRVRRGGRPALVGVAGEIVELALAAGAEDQLLRPEHDGALVRSHVLRLRPFRDDEVVERLRRRSVTSAV